LDLIPPGTSEAAGAAPLWLVAKPALQQQLYALIRARFG
jgi:hypothetical protein